MTSITFKTQQIRLVKTVTAKLIYQFPTSNQNI